MKAPEKITIRILADKKTKVGQSCPALITFLDKDKKSNKIYTLITFFDADMKALRKIKYLEFYDKK